MNVSRGWSSPAIDAIIADELQSVLDHHRLMTSPHSSEWEDSEGVTLSKEWIRHTELLLCSYRHWLRHDLIERSGSPKDDAIAVFEAPIVVVSHGIEADPILSYGNRMALELWEIDIPTLLQTPSRMTAEPMHRDERSRLLTRTSEDGYVDDYSGIRISQTGQRFRIDQAIVWNLMDADGEHCGQAATFSDWIMLPD